MSSRSWQMLPHSGEMTVCQCRLGVPCRPRGRYVTCSIFAESDCLRAAKTRRSHVATLLHDEKKMRSLAARILLLLCLALALLGSHAAEPEAASPSASAPEHTQEEMDEAREEFESIDTNKV